MSAPHHLINTMRRWREAYNPMRGLTLERCVRHLEEYQQGIMANVQWLFAHIEGQDATLLTVIENLDSAIGEIDWDIAQVSPDSRRFDPILAAEQEACLRSAYENIENLSEAISHLVMARFRGFAHLAPWCRLEGRLDTLYRLHPLHQWNMVRQGLSGPWAYNPSADPIDYAQTRPDYRLTPNDALVRERPRYVNRLALIKYIRATTAEKDWDAYVEIYGIPACYIVLPQTIPTDSEGRWLELAKQATEGGSGVLPGGSDVKTLSENRAIQPFQARLEWLEKQLVLAATGGMLTVLAESGSGTLVGSVHKTVFDTLAAAEAKKVAETLQAWLDRRLLNAAFPGKPHLAAFNLSRPEEKDVGEVVTQVCALRAAGIDVTKEQIEEMTGYTIAHIRDLTPPAGALDTLPTRGHAAFAALPHAACATPAPPAQASRKDRVTDLWLRLRRAGYAPIARRVYALLTAPEGQAPHAAKALLDDLPALSHTLMRDSPLGAALAEELKTAYTDASEATPSPTATFRNCPQDGGFLSKGGACHHRNHAANQVGKSGDWKSLGLKPGRDIKGDAPAEAIFAEEARELIRKGDTVKNPLGDTLKIDERTYKHINKKGRSQEEVLVRLREYPQMKACISNPHEIWMDEKTGRRKYVQFLEVNGGKVINAVDEDKNHILSWHSNMNRLDYYRKGKLIYVRQGTQGK